MSRNFNIGGARASVLWLDQVDLGEGRTPLAGDTEADVAIVGGGFSGLWTAYYLLRHDPSLRVLVLEKRHVGFGASGRNGGWCIGELAGTFEKYARRSSPAEALRQARAVFDTVDDIGRVTTEESIDCDFVKGGTIRVARNRPQAERQVAEIEAVRAEGFTTDEIRLLDADATESIIGASNVRSGIFFSPSAALHPAKLVVGLAEAVERRGGVIHERTTVTGFETGVVHTDRGTVRARHVVRATEAYTRDLKGEGRALLPIYSFMIATEPLAADVLDSIGLADRPTFADDRYMVIYGQRTADDRIAFGGTGTPYLWRSGIRGSVEYDIATHRRIHEVLIDFFPQLADAAITHRWGGVLAIPRNWVPGLTYDPQTGVGRFGGYVGEGVAASHLAGQTMAELVTGQSTDRTSLPWVGATARRWEPEPLRYVGVRTSRRILAAADQREFDRDSPSSIAFAMSRLLRGAGR